MKDVVFLSHSICQIVWAGGRAQLTSMGLEVWGWQAFSRPVEPACQRGLAQLLTVPRLPPPPRAPCPVWIVYTLPNMHEAFLTWLDTHSGIHNAPPSP